MRLILLYFSIIMTFCVNVSIAQHVNAHGRNALPPSGFGTINDWYCDHTTKICFAVGFKVVHKQEVPLLLKSVNGFYNWVQVDISHLAPLGRLMTVNCAWSAAICIALGVKNTTTHEPILLQSTDTKTWVAKVLPTESYHDLSLNVSACTGEASKSFCMLAGTFNHGTSPVIMQTNNLGSAWQAYDFTYLQMQNKIALQAIQLSSASCAGTSDQTTCVIYGDHNIISTNNRGKLWTLST